MIGVFVTSGLTSPGRPVRGMVSPLSAALFLTLSAVSPCAMYQRISPLLRSIALMRAYGGFRSANPRTDRPPPPPSAAGAAAGAGGAFPTRPPPAPPPPPPRRRAAGRAPARLEVMFDRIRGGAA